MLVQVRPLLSILLLLSYFSVQGPGGPARSPRTRVSTRQRVESYGDLTLHDLSMHCKNLYELSLAGKMMCYGSLS